MYVDEDAHTAADSWTCTTRPCPKKVPSCLGRDGSAFSIEPRSSTGDVLLGAFSSRCWTDLRRRTDNCWISTGATPKSHTQQWTYNSCQFTERRVSENPNSSNCSRSPEKCSTAEGDADDFRSNAGTSHRLGGQHRSVGA